MLLFLFPSRKSIQLNDKGNGMTRKKLKDKKMRKITFKALPRCSWCGNIYSGGRCRNCEGFTL